MVKAPSWTKTHFYPKADETGDYRFCKVCYPHPDEVPKSQLLQCLVDGRNPIHELHGLVQEVSGSSGLSNHLKQFAKKCSDHAAVLPEGIPLGRKRKAPMDLGVNENMVRDWALDMVLEELVPVRKACSKGGRRFFRKWCKGMSGTTKLHNVVKEVVTGIRTEVKTVVEEAKRKGTMPMFALQGDTWKPKMRRRKHYLAVILSFIDPTKFEFVEVCIHVGEMKGPRTGSAYANEFKKAPSEVELVPEDLVSTNSDHEGAVRKGLREMRGTSQGEGAGVPSVGCACHAFQLPVKHVIPPLKPKSQKDAPADAKDAPATASDDDSTSSSDASNAASDSDVSVSSEDTESDVPPRVAHQQERAKLTAELEPLIKKARQIVKFFIGNDDILNNVSEHALETNTPFSSFVAETPTRWSSSLMSWVRLLFNHKAMKILESYFPHVEEAHANEGANVIRSHDADTADACIDDLSHNAQFKGLCPTRKFVVFILENHCVS